MATIEKLVKAVEGLKVFPVSSPDDPKKKDQLPTKKDKIVHCNTVCDCICSQNMRTLPEFPKFLGIAMETLLTLCDDPEADVRLVADECINKTIRALSETNLGRMQVELYKEIKKNGCSRSLRAALSRFASLCHLIRPQKCRPYVLNLVPCLARICHRPEDAIQETVAAAMPKICTALMCFANDMEIKSLLRSLLPKLTSDNATSRRTAATSLTLICQHSRSPQLFFKSTLNAILGHLMPVEEAHHTPTLLGALLAIRHLLPHILNPTAKAGHIKGSFGITKSEKESNVTTEQLLQVYEILLFFTQHHDHNVVTATLEALQAFLRQPPPELVARLTQRHSIETSQIHCVGCDAYHLGKMRTESTTTLPSLSDDRDVLNDSDALIDTECRQSPDPVLTNETVDIGGSSAFYHREPDGAAAGPSQQGDNSVTLDTVAIDTSYSSVEIGRLNDERSEKSSQSCLTHSDSQDTLRSQSPSQDTSQIDDENGNPKAEDVDDHDDSVPNSPFVMDNDANLTSFPNIGPIGTFIDGEISLVYCARLLCQRFLLGGQEEVLVDDRNVRVSIKVLSLTCVANIVRIYPAVMAYNLFIGDDDSDCQQVKDVLLYTSHHDPQLKGNAALLIGYLIKAALIRSNGNFKQWIDSLTHTPKLDISLDSLVSTLVTITEDPSAVAARLATMALKLCIPSLLTSSHSQLGLGTVLNMVNVSHKPYWLVKVELLNMVGELDMRVLSYLEQIASSVKRGGHHFLGKLDIQKTLLNDVVFRLLGDDDVRVRNHAATILVRLVPNLFYAPESHQHDPVTAVASHFTQSHLNPTLQEWSYNVPPLVMGLVDPYHNQPPPVSTVTTLESNLSRVITSVLDLLLQARTKYMTYGCCRTLSLLSQHYPVTTHPTSWNVATPVPLVTQDSNRPGIKHLHKRTMSIASLEDLGSCGGGSLPVILSLLTSSPVGLDLTAHHDALNLAANLFAGSALNCLRVCEDTAPSDTPTEDTKWPSLSDRILSPLVERLFIHITKLINMCYHLLEDITPGPPPSKTLPSLPNNPILSPIKRKSKADPTQKEGTPDSECINLTYNKEKDKETEKDKVKKDGVGSFYNLPFYMKLYDVLKGAYSNYRVSVDCDSNDKFCLILRAALTTLSKLLEVSTLTDVGDKCDLLLTYLKTCMGIEPATTIAAVQQLLKALFGTNLATQADHTPSTNTTRKPGKATRVNPSSRGGLYHSCFTLPLSQLTHSLSTAAFRASSSVDQHDQNTFSWLKRRVERKVPTILRPNSKVEKTSIATYIRMFEPLVIKALKQYTVTSSVDLQREVLSLLCQLVQLRVNYCLLDSDQIFLQFVIKQFEYIEEGQIRQSEKLVPAIFQFLVILSYEKFNSKAVTAMPKIIQLCDGIMASGLQATTHVMPAVQTIVYDLFLVRGNKGELAREVDTQREVVISVLLRLLEHPQILELLTVVLHWCHKDGEDKWKRLSRQITDILLPMLVQQQVHIDCQTELDVIHLLFESVSASVFRPVDIILKTLFKPPPEQNDSVNLEKWMCLVLAMLRVLLTQSKEEVILSRLHDLRLPLPSFLIGAETSADLQPDQLLARFLLCVVYTVATEITAQCHGNDDNKPTFLCQQLSHFLLYLTHLLQSGSFRRVTTAASRLLRSADFPTSDINASFLSLGLLYPTLCLQWANGLILLNYDDMDWWSTILRTPHSYKTLGSGSSEKKNHRSPLVNCNSEVMRRGALVIFSDFVSENLVETEHMTWLIINHVSDLIELSHEPPVSDFIGAIHRNSAASGLFIQAIQARHSLSKPSMVKRTLSCLEAIHMSQCGALLSLLVDKFLVTPHLAVARYCDVIACRRVEMLLAETVQVASKEIPKEEIERMLEFFLSCFLVVLSCFLMVLSNRDARKQIPQEELERMLELLRCHNLTHRHPQLVSLLIKLHGLLSSQTKLSLSPEKSHPLITTTTDTADITIDKAMYVNIVKEQCFNPAADPKECALMLQRLDYADVLSIIMCDEFHLSILKGCISLGLMRTLVSYSRMCDQFETSTLDSPHHPPVPDYDDLFKAASLTLFRHINNIINLLPVPHEILVFNVTATPKELRYRQNLDLFLSSPYELTTVFNVTSALVQYLQSIQQVPWQDDLATESVADCCRLAVLCTEIISWQINEDQLPTSEFLEVAMTCLDLTLQNLKLCAFFGHADNMSWVCTAIYTVYQILSSLLVVPGQKLAILPNHDMREDQASTADESRHMIAACDKMNELLECLKTHLNGSLASRLSISDSLMANIIIGLSRFTVVNSCTRTPPLVWRMGWMPSPCGEMKTAVPPVPLEYLLDKDVLKEFIFRINTLGWTSRQQFEETWMGLLGVLHSTTTARDTPLSPEEDLERNQTLVLAVRAITSLLIQSTLTPQAGNPANSVFDCQPRDKPLVFLQTRCGKKLGFVRSLVEKEIRSLLHHIRKNQCETQLSCTYQGLKYLFEENLERDFETDDYTWGQISIDTVWSLTGMMDLSPVSDNTDSVDSPETDMMPQQRIPSDTKMRPPTMNNVDIQSCLRFLSELYHQWLDTETKTTPLMLLNEIIKSIVVLSDLFHDQAQFEWMQAVLMDVYRSHPAEDEITDQYLNVGICKASAVIGLDMSMGEKIIRLIESGLRSTHLSSKVSTLQGLLYILELGKSDTCQQLVGLAMEFVCKHISAISHACLTSQQYLLTMWSVGFYIMENFQEYLLDTEYHTKFMQLALTSASSNEDITSTAVYIVLLRGFERLLLADVFSKQDCDTLIKLSVDRLCLPSPLRALPALGLLLTCMYTGKQLDQYSPRPRDTEPVFHDLDSTAELYNDPESLILAMERISVLFDRIKKGTPYEAQVIARILPAFLADFFPPQDIMNKVIGEFISNQQPHPQLIAKVVFQVFNNLLQTQQQAVVQDWVMLSLSNFTQRTPVAMAIWSLTSFFISASSNTWLRALFPHVLNRLAKLEILDRRLFLLAAKDFFSQLTDPTQKRTFLSTFQSVCQSESLYRELVALLPT